MPLSAIKPLITACATAIVVGHSKISLKPVAMPFMIWRELEKA